MEIQPVVPQHRCDRGSKEVPDGRPLIVQKQILDSLYLLEGYESCPILFTFNRAVLVPLDNPIILLNVFTHFLVLVLTGLLLTYVAFCRRLFTDSLWWTVLRLVILNIHFAQLNSHLITLLISQFKLLNIVT